MTGLDLGDFMDDVDYEDLIRAIGTGFGEAMGISNPSFHSKPRSTLPVGDLLGWTIVVDSDADHQPWGNAHHWGGVVLYPEERDAALAAYKALPNARWRLVPVYSPAAEHVSIPIDRING